MDAHDTLAVGDPVIYRPHPGAPAEDGVVSSLSSNPTMVFVRYAGAAPDAPGKATYVADLERARPHPEAPELPPAVAPPPAEEEAWVEVVTRYGGFRHLAPLRDSRGAPIMLRRGRHQTACRGTSAWTLQSWAATPDHPQGLTVDDMVRLPLCVVCSDLRDRNA